MGAFAAVLPVTVISDLLGIPAGDRDDFRAWTNAMLATFPPDREAMAKAIESMARYVGELVHSRRRSPGDDLLSALLAARDTDDRLSEDELTSLVFLTLFAGYENSVNLIANTFLVRLSNGSSLSVSEAIEESLRLYPPAPVSIRRFPTRDVTIAGTAIPAGATVLLSIAAANRDPASSAEPHLSFGRGIHYCVGAPLARVEAQIAVETALRRLPDLALAGPTSTLHWRPSFRTLGLVALHVTWSS